MIETSTQTTILFTNCKSRSDNSKSHRVTKYLHKLYHMYYTVVYSRETFDNGTSSSRLSAKVSLIPVSQNPPRTISGLLLMCWTILTSHFADNEFSHVKERSTGWITSSSDSEPLFSFNCLTISSAYQSSNDCRKRFYTAFWTLTSNGWSLSVQQAGTYTTFILFSDKKFKKSSPIWALNMSNIHRAIWLLDIFCVRQTFLMYGRIIFLT